MPAVFNGDVEAGLSSSVSPTWSNNSKNDGSPTDLDEEQHHLLGRPSSAPSIKPKSAQMGARRQPGQGIMKSAFSDNNNGSLPRNVILSTTSSEDLSPTSPLSEEPTASLINVNVQHVVPFNGAALLQANPGRGHHHHNIQAAYPAIPSTCPSKNNTLTSTDSKLRNKISSKYGRYRKRVVFKNGDINLNQTNISKRKRRYLADIFTTLVDIQWRWTLLIFTLSFILSWLFFAMIWWLISFVHGDLDFDHLPDQQEASGWKPCIFNIYGFTSAFLFSIETQHTIGYGSRYTTEECSIAITCMCMQSILGVMIQALMVGIVFAKMSRPKKRTQTLMFSRHGVVNQRDGDLCLMFRVGDMRKSQIISANVRAQLIKRVISREGEVMPYYQHELKVGVDSNQSEIFFIWPMMVVHKIDKDSPLYGCSAADLMKERFEIVLILEGVIETTGATTQARSSYLPSEILWGHRFEPMVSFKKDVGEYAVDHSLFNHTYEVDTPLISAKDWDELTAVQTEMKRQGASLLTTNFRMGAIAQHQTQMHA